MNKEYISINGQVVILDETGNKKLKKYSNNLDEILMTENEIENIDNLLQDKQTKEERLERRLKEAKKDRKTWLVTPTIGVVLGIILVSLFGGYAIIKQGICNNLLDAFKILYTGFSPFSLKVISVTIGSIVGVMSIGGSLVYHLEYKSIEKEIISYKAKIKFLEISKQKAIDKLNELDRENKPINQDTNYIEKKFDTTEEQRLQRRLAMYDYLIKSKRNLEKYLQTGKLPNNLENSGFDQNDIEIIKETINQKALSLTKKNNKH